VVLGIRHTTYIMASLEKQEPLKVFCTVVDGFVSVSSGEKHINGKSPSDEKS
jgi:hypothetical protein